MAVKSIGSIDLYYTTIFSVCQESGYFPAIVYFTTDFVNDGPFILVYPRFVLVIPLN